ncbi:IS3 family transposase [Streptococcus danieliae]|uniref:IS3 family transposase n=1 Tax=Streptococcus danieliae TaxID=747656 RepID=UPI0013667561
MHLPKPLHSLSAPGVPYDNAVSERTYRSFKTEFVNAYKFESLEQLALLTQDYIHWWNHKRRYSTLNNLSPLVFKAQPITTQENHGQAVADDSTPHKKCPILG